MYIYIDESGSFSNPSNLNHSISCIGAIVIPESCHANVISKFVKLRQSWGERVEVKGSKLNEIQRKELFRILKPKGVLFISVIIDFGLNKSLDIEQHRNFQVSDLRKLSNESSDLKFRNTLHDLEQNLTKLSVPLYAQLFMMNSLVIKVVQNATIYYSQRLPRELESFKWVIDAKDVKRTAYEDLWMKIVLPYVQAESFRNPLGVFEEGDYRYFTRFNHNEIPTQYENEFTESDPLPGDIKMILSENRIFVDSKHSAGIQIADIAVNTLRRSMKGNLLRHGYEDLGSLIIHEKGGPFVMHFFTVGNKIFNKNSLLEYPEVLRILRKKNRNMIAKSILMKK